MEGVVRSRIDICRRGGEFENVTVDYTVKPTIPLVGQTGHNKKKKRKRRQAIPYMDQLHAVLILRGSSGCALLVEPVFSEGIEAACGLYMEKLTYIQRRQVKYIASDTVSPGQYRKLRGVFPLLKCCALDPMHLAIAVEQSTWEYKSELSISIRKVLSKFNPVYHGEAASGNFYNGEPLESTSQEVDYRADLIFQTNCAVKARGRIQRINCERGLKSRAEFCMYLADLVVAYPELSSKRTNASRAVWEHLYAACDPAKIEWYLNNERIRMSISPHLADHMAFGTTGSEAMNSEVKRWFAQINQMRASVLRLKLRVFQLCNLAAFCSAMYNKTIRQVRKPLVLSRLKSNWKFFGRWADWCASRNNGDAVNRNRDDVWYGDGCNLMEEMAEDARLIDEWKESRENPGRRGVRKRPRKQTVFRQKKARGK